MPFSEGDTVIIDLQLGIGGVRYEPARYESGMDTYRGMRAIIVRVRSHGNMPYYKLDIDMGAYNWSDGMFVLEGNYWMPVPHEQERVTPEFIEACVRQTGLIPNFDYDDYSINEDGRFTANIFGLIDAAVFGGDPQWFFDSRYDPHRTNKMMYDTYYYQGLYDGFVDGVNRPYTGSSTNAEMRTLGRQDGYAVRQHLVNINLIERESEF